MQTSSAASIGLTMTFSDHRFLRRTFIIVILLAQVSAVSVARAGATGECSGEQLASRGGCQLAYDAIVFNLQTTATGSLNQLTVQAAGLEKRDLNSTHEIDGNAYRAEVADLDANGWPEVYVYVSSAGSGSYGSLVAYAVNNGKSATPIYLRPLTENDAATAGYMGHDEFAALENRLVRRFPVYTDGDTNSAPTGGMRQVQYRLVPGEAGWLLEIDRVVEY